MSGGRVILGTAAGWLEPPGYARTLGWMIAAFIAGFAVALGVFVVAGGAL